MPWLDGDLERIRKALKVPAEKQHLDILRTCMSRLERQSPETIATVQGILDDIEGQKADRRTVRGNSNYAMVKAGSVEWEPGSRTDGFDYELFDLINDLQAALFVDLPNYAGGNYDNSGTLGRS